MTTTFWLAATALIALALVFIAFPLFFRKPRQRAETDRRQQNLMAYRGRMAELEADYKAGNLDEDNYRQVRDELAGSLLDEVGERTQADNTSPDFRRTAPRVVAIASLVLVPLLSVLLYQHWGALAEVEQYQAMQEVPDTEEGRAQEMARLADQLRERLEANPENPEGWAMLGRTYMNLNRHGDAAWAFEQRAGQLSDDDSAAATAWGLAAQARFFESQGTMNDSVMAAIEKARDLNPDEVNALGLLGVNAFEQQNYEQAIEYWQRIEKTAPNHPQLPSIRQGIAAAYDRLGVDAPEPEPAAELSPRGVTVNVELDPAFSDQVLDSTTLFIFARAPRDEGPPLAIATLTASDLPVQVRLDDRRAMAPSAVISNAEEVVLTARLSPSGTAEAQPGDWMGRTEEPVTVSADDAEPVLLVIDTQLR